MDSKAKGMKQLTLYHHKQTDTDKWDLHFFHSYKYSPLLAYVTKSKVSLITAYGNYYCVSNIKVKSYILNQVGCVFFLLIKWVC